MKTLQVSMENRLGCTLRGIVTLLETNEPVPFVLNLHGFAGSASGYKYLHTHMARMLAAHGVGCARFDFYGCGESDGEFSDMTFDGLHSDAADLYAWVRAQPYVDSRRVFLSGQSMGGYVAASIAPHLRPHGLILMCPGAGMWYGWARRADMVTQSGKDYADLEGLVYKMAFNYNMAAHPDPFEEAKGYNGPVIVIRADDDKLVDDESCKRYAGLYQAAEFVRVSGGGHNFATIPSRTACEQAIWKFIQDNL